MKVLITGCQGQLGQCLMETAPDKYTIYAFNSRELDITDDEKVNTILSDLAPECIINAAAYTHVDDAEENQVLAFNVNKIGVANLAKVCKKLNIRIISLSTDYIFDGLSVYPYTEEDKPNPMSVYGCSKLAGEHELRNIYPENHLIIRTSWLYSKFGNNFVKTMINLMKSRNELCVVDDQIGTPCWVKNLAYTIWYFTENLPLNGIYHYSDSGVASWYDFAVAIQEEALMYGILKGPIAINPVSTAAYPTVAKRPPNSCMNKSKIKNDTGISIKHWRANLREMMKELC